MAVAKHQMADRIQIVQRLRKMIAFTDQAGEGMPSTYTGHYGATVVELYMRECFNRVHALQRSELGLTRLQ